MEDNLKNSLKSAIKNELEKKGLIVKDGKVMSDKRGNLGVLYHSCSVGIIRNLPCSLYYFDRYGDKYMVKYYYCDTCNMFFICDYISKV